MLWRRLFYLAMDFINAFFILARLTLACPITRAFSRFYCLGLSVYAAKRRLEAPHVRRGREGKRKS